MSHLWNKKRRSLRLMRTADSCLPCAERILSIASITEQADYLYNRIFHFSKFSNEKFSGFGNIFYIDRHRIAGQSQPLGRMDTSLQECRSQHHTDYTVIAQTSCFTTFRLILCFKEKDCRRPTTQVWPRVDVRCNFYILTIPLLNTTES